jgi:hypothetical protein
MKLKSLSIALWAIACSSIFFFGNAGTNEKANVYFDADFRTDRIEPVLQFLNKGDTCFVSIRVNAAMNLNSYSIILQFDSSIVAIRDAADKKSLSEKPFLESTGKKSISLKNLKGNEAEFAAALQGAGLSVSGNGCLAYFSFNCVKSGNPAIVIKEVKLVAPNGTIDKLP